METKTEIVNIVIDGKHYKVHTHEMTGSALKTLAGIPPENLLFREVHGPGDDEQVQNDTVVHLHDGDHFYDMPPGTFGRR
jgi:hypothetical protein